MVKHSKFQTGQFHEEEEDEDEQMTKVTRRSRNQPSHEEEEEDNEEAYPPFVTTKASRTPAANPTNSVRSDPNGNHLTPIIMRPIPEDG